MSYLSEASLRSQAPQYHLEVASNRVIKRRADEAAVSIFLSHSHSDGTLVRGFIAQLAKLGVQIYVDWQDANLPAVTDRRTADAVKTQIGRNELFVVLATPNALTSRWVPWEIGVADQMKGPDRMFIVPVLDASGKFTGNEYLQLYQRISTTRSGLLGVFEPGQTSGDTAESILRGFAR